MSTVQPQALLPPTAVPREAAERVLDYLVFHKALIDDQLDRPPLLERYLALVQKQRDGVHVVIDDPFEKATALLFELVMEEQFDPWEIDLVRFTESYLERVHANGAVDFAVAGRLLFMAWNILYLQSKELLDFQDRTQGPDAEAAAQDDGYLSSMDSSTALEVTETVLTSPTDPPLVAMVRHSGTRPVSLLELVQAFGRAEKDARRAVRIEELRERLREEQRAPPEVLVHGDIPVRDLDEAWASVASHPVGEPFPLLDLWHTTQGRDRLVALFLACLFLAREHALELRQDRPSDGPVVVVRTLEQRIPMEEN